MKTLFLRLNAMRRQSVRELTEDQVSKRVKRVKDAFLCDYPNEAERQDVYVLFETIRTKLDDTPEADKTRAEMSTLRRDFKIDEDLTKPVDGYPKFKERLEKLTYIGRLAAQEREADDLSSASAVDPASAQESTTETEIEPQEKRR